MLEKFRSGEYKVDNLHIIDEANSRLLEIGGVKLRLLGLGGAVVMHKLFDNGEGRTTIAGGQGTMWTTLLQMGELVDTANRVYDPTETRLFVTHASPAREGILNQLSVTLKADFSISAGLHFRYGSSYNEFSVNPTLDHYRGKLAASKASFNDVWETVKGEVEPAVAQNEAQQTLLQNALDIVQKMPSVANGGNPFGGPVTGSNAGGQVDESAFKNMWNFNLADAAFGWLVLEVDGGRIGTEMRAQGFNFAHRGGKQGGSQSIQASAASPATTSAAPSGNNIPPSAPTGPAQSRPTGGPSAASAPQPNHNQQPNQNQQPRSYQAAVQQQPQPSQQPQSTQQQQQQAKPPAAPSRTGPSPSQTVSTAPLKPATPQPCGTNVNLPAPATTDKAPPSKANEVRNGAATADKPAASPVAKATSPVEKTPSTGIFISNVANEQAAREMIPEEDRAKIQKLRSIGKSWVAHFSTAEEMQAVLERSKAARPADNQHNGPSVKPYVERERAPRQPFNRDNQGEGGAGRWQGSNRGGANAPQQQPGYRSGGASDSEGGRGGRGGFTRGRGRGGERGRGRGGRGSYNNKPAGDGATSAAATPAPAAPSGGEP